MALLTRAAILAAEDITIETVPIPEWGDEVRLRSLSGEEREAMDTMLYDTRKAGGRVQIMAIITAFSVIDEHGARIFTDQDIPMLARKDSKPLQRIYDWHTKHSGIGVKGLEDAVKNSGPGQSGAGASASPSA